MGELEPMTYAFPVVPRYAEVDQQGVVFNGHYLTWFDEAFTGFLDHAGMSYPDLIAAGVDVMVVHSELDYRGSVRWRDDARVEVVCERQGTTSFTLGFSVYRSADEVAVTGRNVYVVVVKDEATGAWSKAPGIPEKLAAALSGA
ncbi:acyl-CoA thioesterase [Actinomycetospora lemnae]|uniref:Acyl-CoA thioesterase n=1 Tax=Actinomycetospora lemnae TaxID=3019891 RepID=A0ABT5ST68_9PSEU|nr:acyl-CoA thioesterase [Actinomycetospora sp. DW7H6]MDD7965237.1 acyl-CoA thioesterase [Actinomycetospora sp. DW7H6]